LACPIHFFIPKSVLVENFINEKIIKKFMVLSMSKIMSVMLIFFFISGSFVTAFSFASASETVENSWHTKTPMSQARSGLGVIAVDDKVYAIGGSTRNGYVGTNEQYDPKTDTWVILKSMPTPRADFGITAYRGKIYCIGNGPTEVYDIATDSWSVKKSIPINGDALQAHTVNGKIFVMVSYLMYMYDPVIDSWTQKTSLPTSEYYRTGYSAVIDNQIIAIKYGDANLLIYDPKTDRWSREKTTVGYNGSFGVAVFAATSGSFAPQRIYALSGGSSIFFAPTGFIMAYNPLSGTWEKVKDDPTPRAKSGVAVLDDVLYVIGGLRLESDGQRVDTAVNEQYVPIGYSNTAYTTATPANSNPPKTTKPSDTPYEPSLTYVIVAVLALTIGIIAMGLFFYFKKCTKPKRHN
jgi:hypothetical protein